MAPKASTSKSTSSIPQPWLTNGGIHAPKFPGLPLQKTQLNKLQRLNLTRNYCNNPTWTPKAGFRELIQNVVDGILQAAGLQQHQLRVEEYRDGKLVTPEEAASASTLPEEPIERKTVEFFFYRQDTPTPTEEGKKIAPLGYVAWRPDPKKLGYGDIELFNIGTMTKIVWSIGYSSKPIGGAGGHGEGAKLGESTNL